MAPPASFTKLCASAKISLPPSAQRVQFLLDAGIPADSVNSTAKELSERAAALSWASASLAADTDPDSWTTSLPANLPVLASLYHLPPHRGPSPAPSDLHRLAAMIRMFDPNGALAPVPLPPTAAGTGTSIDIGPVPRPGHTSCPSDQTHCARLVATGGSGLAVHRQPADDRAPGDRADSGTLSPPETVWRIRDGGSPPTGRRPCPQRTGTLCPPGGEPAVW
jgi:hypothetical protein